MATPVKLPALGESVTEGTVTRWLKQVGDSVEVDEALLEVSTDKVDTEIPSPVAGTLLEIKVDEDETVEVGAELAVVERDATTEPTTRPPRRVTSPRRLSRRATSRPPRTPRTTRPPRASSSRGPRHRRPVARHHRATGVAVRT
jgi:pyruvate dehydrogenase E2 component (dihydrolipoamide acetyltransferase)